MSFFNLFKKEIETEIIEVDDVKFPVKIHYENRTNSRASIGKRSVNIRIPFFLTPKLRIKEKTKLLSWAEGKLKENTHKRKPRPIREYKDNDILKIGDKDYILKIDYKEKKSSSAKLIDNNIYLSVSSKLSKEKEKKHIATLLSRLIGQERLPGLIKKVMGLNEKYFNRNINKISFKHQRSRWGSCSSKGNINISTRLLFAPDDVLEYVCIHELAHLVYLNHSKKFWALVARAVPDYKDKQKWLKENEEKCDF